MKLSISNIAWKKNDDEEMYKFISEQGFDGLEIAPTRIFDQNPYDCLQEAEKFAKDLKKNYNLDISSMQSIWFGKTERIFGSSEERNELIKYTKKAIDFAEKISCHNLVFGCPKNKNRITGTDDEYKIGIKFFKEIGEYAQNKNVVFAIEANPTVYNTNFINTTKEAIQIVKDVDSRGVKVNFDLGTVLTNNEGLKCLEDNIELINHIHISEPSMELIQKREIHNDLLKIISSKNYDKFVSIEVKTMEKLEDVKYAIKYVKEVFKNGV